jgi:hypothetical protein
MGAPSSAGLWDPDRKSLSLDPSEQMPAQALLPVSLRQAALLR